MFSTAYTPINVMYKLYIYNVCPVRPPRGEWSEFFVLVFINNFPQWKTIHGLDKMNKKFHIVFSYFKMLPKTIETVRCLIFLMYLRK